MDNFYLTFGEGVRQHRRSLRWSQEQLANKALMGRATVASIEAGRQVVALHQALSLCTVLGVELKALIPQSHPSESRDLELEGLLEAHDLEIIRELKHGLTT